MRDEAWFESRGKTLYRSFLWSVAKTIVTTEKAGYDPKTLSVSSMIEHSRMELKTLSTEDAMKILLQQKNGELHVFYLPGAGYMVEYKSCTKSWQVCDDRFEDALQRVLDQISEVEIW